MERVLWKFLLTFLGSIAAYIISYLLLSDGPEQSKKFHMSRFGELRSPKYKSVDAVSAAQMTAFYRPLYLVDGILIRRGLWKVPPSSKIITIISKPREPQPSDPFTKEIFYFEQDQLEARLASQSFPVRPVTIKFEAK